MSLDDNALSLGSRASTTTQAATEEAKGSVAEASTIPAEKSDAAPQESSDTNIEFAPSSLIPEEEKVPEASPTMSAVPQSEARALDPAIAGIIT